LQLLNISVERLCLYYDAPSFTFRQQSVKDALNVSVLL
jgi:hypothetical protein